MLRYANFFWEETMKAFWKAVFIIIAAVALIACGESSSDDSGGTNTGGTSTPSYSVSVTTGGQTATYTDAAVFGAYYNAQNPPIPAASTGIVAVTGGGSSGIIFSFEGQSTGTYDVASNAALSYTDAAGQTYAANALLNSVASGTITVTEYGAVGGKIGGSFNVVASIYAAGSPTANTATLTGTFEVQRKADDFSF